MIKRKCPWKKCKTLVEVDEMKDCTMLNALIVDFCDKHWEQYRKQHEYLDTLVPKYNKMGILNKYGKPRIFHSGNEISNYLYTHDIKELDRLHSEAIKL